MNSNRKEGVSLNLPCIPCVGQAEARALHDRFRAPAPIFPTSQGAIALTSGEIEAGIIVTMPLAATVISASASTAKLRPNGKADPVGSWAV